MYPFDCITVHIGIALAAHGLNSSNAFCNHTPCAHRELMDPEKQKVYSTALATAARLKTMSFVVATECAHGLLECEGAIGLLDSSAHLQKKTTSGRA